MRDERMINERSNEEEIVIFDPYAKIYDETREVSSELLTKMIYHLESRGYIDIERKPRLLEVGSGTGRIACAFTSAGYLVTGIDLAKEMIQQGINKRLSGACFYYQPILADGRKLPILENSMDFCYTIHVLHLIKDWKTVVNEILRCSKHKLYMNGKIFRNYHELPIWKKYWEFLEEQFGHQPASRPGMKNEEELTEYLAKQSFKVVKISDTAEVTINRTKIINILVGKSYSSQRNVPTHLHQEAVNYLKKHDYFLPSKVNWIKAREKLELWIYYP